MDSVRTGLGATEYEFWWAFLNPREFPNRLEVVEFLRGFKASLESMRRLSEVLDQATGKPVSERLDDDELIEQLATLLWERRLRVRTIHRETPSIAGAQGGLPPPARRVAPPPAPSAPARAAAPPPEPDEEVDAEQQAAALIKAAESGVPFCEECERRKRQRAAA